MKRFLMLALCLCFIAAKAQVQVHFKLLNADDSCYLAGNINNWNPADIQYRFSKTGLLTTTVAPGTSIQYKLTKGSWASVECDALGADIPNRTLEVLRDTTIQLTVESWKTDFANVAIQKHTASSRVSILDSAFVIHSLGRTRTIRIYLPKDYQHSSKRYPVMYMHDGQNLFDIASSFSGEWEVDETLDRVYDSCGRSMIVVAIDNGGDHRLQEYNPYDNAQFGKGEGKEYVSFIVNQLKPLVDSSFRTLKDKQHTSIAGSSMGGLISVYALLAYPKIFGTAGVFSPSFWVASSIYNMVNEQGKKLDNNRLFFYAGGKESAGMVPDIQKMKLLLEKYDGVKTKLVIDEHAQHNEQAWSVYFPLYYNWLLQQQASLK